MYSHSKDCLVKLLHCTQGQNVIWNFPNISEYFNLSEIPIWSHSWLALKLQLYARENRWIVPWRPAEIKFVTFSLKPDYSYLSGLETDDVVMRPKWHDWKSRWPDHKLLEEQVEWGQVTVNFSRLTSVRPGKTDRHIYCSLAIYRCAMHTIMTILQ